MPLPSQVGRTDTETASQMCVAVYIVVPVVVEFWECSDDCFEQWITMMMMMDLHGFRGFSVRLVNPAVVMVSFWGTTTTRVWSEEKRKVVSTQ